MSLSEEATVKTLQSVLVNSAFILSSMLQHCYMQVGQACTFSKHLTKLMKYFKKNYI